MILNFSVESMSVNGTDRRPSIYRRLLQMRLHDGDMTALKLPNESLILSEPPFVAVVLRFNECVCSVKKVL